MSGFHTVPMRGSIRRRWSRDYGAISSKPESRTSDDRARRARSSWRQAEELMHGRVPPEPGMTGMIISMARS